jgi:hypothetical protein
MPSFKEIILTPPPKNVEPTPASIVATVAPVATVPVPVPVKEELPPPSSVIVEPEEEEAQEEEAQEEEALEPFDFQGKEYYKDAENNVYTANEEGEVDETPVGRWVEKRQTIKFYNLNA